VAAFVSIEQVSEIVPGAGCSFVKFVYAQQDTSLYICCSFLVSTSLFAPGMPSSEHSTSADKNSLERLKTVQGDHFRANLDLKAALN